MIKCIFRIILLIEKVIPVFQCFNKKKKGELKLIFYFFLFLTIFIGLKNWKSYNKEETPGHKYVIKNIRKTMKKLFISLFLEPGTLNDRVFLNLYAKVFEYDSITRYWNMHWKNVFLSDKNCT